MSRLRQLGKDSVVYGVGGAGCNAVSRLHEEGLFGNRFVTGHAINTDAQALLMNPIENKVLIGRTARGRGAGGHDGFC